MKTTPPINEVLKVHNGPIVKRTPSPKLTLAQRRARDEKRAAEGAIAIAEHEASEKAKQDNMERLRAERLARSGM